MHTEPHRLRFFLMVFLLTVLALLFARPSHGGWSADPVQVHATNASVPLVAVTGDGHAGALVVWQEATTAPKGRLMAMRVTSGGSPDPSWPEPLIVAGDERPRTGLACVRDGQGGAYVLWSEGAQFFVTRIAAYGAVADGWTDDGLALGFVSRWTPLPQLEPDGLGGVWLAWIGASQANAFPRRHLAHLGPDGRPATGWAVPTIALPDFIAERSLPTGFTLARRDDGGVWLGWSTLVFDPADEETGTLEYHLSRLRPDGRFATGWNATGRVVGTWTHRADELAGQGMRPFALASAPGGEVVMNLSRPDEGSVGSFLESHRFDAAGNAVHAWPLEGSRLPGGFDALASPILSPMLMLSREDVIAYGAGGLGTESSQDYWVGRLPDLDPQGRRKLRMTVGMDFHATLGEAGGLAIGAASPFAWHNGITGDIARITACFTAADGRSAEFSECRPDAMWVAYYRASNVAVLDEANALFVWSQERERFGVFAKLLTVAPPVLASGGPSARAEISVRFQSGVGIVFRARFPEPAETRLLLLDVQGRRVTSMSLAAGELARRALPATEALAAGLYFLRVTHGEDTFLRRVTVAR